MSREMKDSGIEWIGQIPKEWNTISFTNSIIRMSTGLNPRDNFELTKNDEYFYVTIKNFKDGKIYLDENCDRISKEAWEIIQERSQLQKGDILFASISKDGQAYIVEEFPSNWNINESVFCIRVNPKFFYNRYFYYHITDSEYYNNLRLDATGTTFQSIKQNKLKKSVLCHTNKNEQQKIAVFLDKVCGEVDEMVALQEKMIEELKAYKQSVITEAVTKGLNPNVPMRDSGIDWIGEIPENWEQHQFRRIFEIKKVIAGTLGYDVLSVTQNGIKVKDLTKNEGQIAQDYSKYQLVDIDDYVMNHMDLLTGYVDCSKQNGVTSPDYRVFRAIDKSKISLAYYLKIFQTCYKEKIFYHLGQGVSGMGRWRLPAEQLKLFVLPMPPLSEQQQIASYIDGKCSEIDSLIALKQAKIEELKEYKKSVIYEYVTGKKEVV